MLGHRLYLAPSHPKVLFCLLKCIWVSLVLALWRSDSVAALRRLLSEVGAERAQFLRPHDLRRDHAEDLRLSGMCTVVTCTGSPRTVAASRGVDAVRWRSTLEVTGGLGVALSRVHAAPGHPQNSGGIGYAGLPGRGVRLRQPVVRLLAQWPHLVELMQCAGAPLWKLLAAWEWRSLAFMQHLDIHKIVVVLVMQGCLDEESDCDSQ